MNRHRIPRIGRLLAAVGGAVAALLYSLVEAFLQLVGSTDEEPADDRRIYDSEMMGEYNYRTGKVDAGMDPYGWYDRDED